MKKLLSVIAGFSVLVFGFQNCSQQGSSPDESLIPSSTVQSKIEDPDLKEAQVIEIFTLSPQEKISLNLGSGQLIQTSPAGSVEKCLSEPMRAAVLELLNSSSLCEFQPAEDALCAHVYSYPYAEIHWSQKSVKVGERVSSCHKGPDLCGQDGNILRGLLANIISRWDQWSCDFEAL